MAKIFAEIKKEILRLAKKEIRGFFRPLAREFHLQKLKLSKLAREMEPITKWARERVRLDEEAKLQAGAPAEEVKIARLSPARIEKLRRKLGLSQKKLGILVGVSLGTVAAWEKGKFGPKGEKKARLIALRKLGKREVRRILKQKMEEMEKKPAAIKQRRRRVSRKRKGKASARKKRTMKRASKSKR